VICDTDNEKDSDIVIERSCNVSHSNNTVPHFNCSRQVSHHMILNTTGIRQTGDICPLKTKTYNITTLTVNEKDLDERLECDVSYYSPTDSSHVYLTEHFVIPRRVQLSEVHDTSAPSPTTGENFFSLTEHYYNFVDVICCNINSNSEDKNNNILCSGP